MSDNETFEEVLKDRNDWRGIARRLQRELAEAKYGPNGQRVTELEDRIEDRNCMIQGLKARVRSLKQSVEYRNAQIKMQQDVLLNRDEGEKAEVGTPARD